VVFWVKKQEGTPQRENLYWGKIGELVTGDLESFSRRRWWCALKIGRHGIAYQVWEMNNLMSPPPLLFEVTTGRLPRARKGQR
jgi:hypothetical protein